MGIRKGSLIGLTSEMKKKVHDYIDENPEDPVPIPSDDKAPQVYYISAAACLCYSNDPPWF